MAYYTGTVNDMAGLRQALIDACVTDGWAWDDSAQVLSHGSVFLRVRVVSGRLELLGRTSLLDGAAPGVVQVGAMKSDGSHPLTFPASYEVFSFATEVFLVVNYAIDMYQWCAFGRSQVAGLPGTGMWVGASMATASSTFNEPNPIAISSSSGGGARTTSAALAWSTFGDSPAQNFWAHSDLDGQGWWLAQTLGGTPVGITDSAPLIGLLPNTWNSEAVLLPIRAYKVRPADKISLVADLAHARYTRIDNYEPGQIVTVGADRWKVFPWYRKNASARNGGSGIDHTGTFGWAIRYEGP